MATTLQPEPRRQPLWVTRNGILLAATIVSSSLAWWMIAWPVASLSNNPLVAPFDAKKSPAISDRTSRVSLGSS